MREYVDKIMSVGYYSWGYLSAPYKSNAELFVDELNKTLERLKTTKVYLIGDINIGIFSINNAKYASEYGNMLASIMAIFLL